MRHPAETQLALYAGGDLGFLDRVRLGHHVRSCGGCRKSVEAFAAAKSRLRAEAAELPDGLNWDRLSAEMTGNIRVGLAAGECVAAVTPKPQRLTWKPALAVLGLTAIVLSGWWLNFPAEQRDTVARGLQRIWKREQRIAPPDNSVYLEANRAGIQLRENGATLTLMHSDAAPSMVSVSTQGSMRARYVDSDTGQVTITNVYAQ
jgi:hypothetical protein